MLWKGRQNVSRCCCAVLGLQDGSLAETGLRKVDRKVTQLRDEFDWSLLQDGIVVDVGGGNGSTSVSLARVSHALAGSRHLWDF